MHLEEYLKRRHLTRSEFARRIGVTPSYVTMLCSADFWPGKRLMLEILRETQGRVTPNDLLGVDVKQFKQESRRNATDGESRRKR